MIINLPFTKEPGVYVLTNLTNNKKWVGQSNNLRTRLINHYNLLKRNQNSKRIQSDYNKEHYFRFEIIKIMPNSTKNERKELEEYYTELYRSNEKEYGYNIYTGNKPNKEKIEQMSQLNRDRICTEETRRKMSISAKKRGYNGRTKQSIEQGIKTKINKRKHSITAEKAKIIVNKILNQTPISIISKEENVHYNIVNDIKKGKLWEEISGGPIKMKSKYTMNEEQKKRVSEVHKGKTISDEHKQAIKKGGLKLRKFSEEQEIEIAKRVLINGEKLVDLAKEFNSVHKTIANIRDRYKNKIINPTGD